MDLINEYTCPIIGSFELMDPDPAPPNAAYSISTK